MAAVLVLAGLVAVWMAGAGAAAPGLEPSNPTWSPDGTRIAFAYVGGPVERLEVMGASDGGGKHAIYSSTDSCCEPIVWAASGRIVFVDDYRLQSVPAAGGKPTLLFDDSPWFIVSPNRETVAFDDGCGCGHAPDAIGLVDARGGTPRVIPKPRDATDSIDGFSPDGTELIFTRYPFRDGPVRAKPLLMVERLRGGTPVSLRRSGLIGASFLLAGVDDPQWSPDGRWIAFVGARGIEAVGTTGGAAPRVLVPPQFESFSWSPSSTRLAYVAKVGKLGLIERLATVDLHGKRLLLGTAPIGYLSNFSGDRPQWSPDGTKLVFMGADHRIWVVGADGHHLKKLA